MNHMLRHLGTGLVLLGLTLALVLLPALRDVTRAADWPSVPGVVLSSSVVTRVTRETDASGDWIDGERFEPRVTYRYAPAGTDRLGPDVMTHDAASVDEAWARAIRTAPARS